MNKLTPFIATILWLICPNVVFAQSIVINEVVSSNTNVIADEEGSYQDWVELYNNGEESVNLDGFGLTDDATVPFKWMFPNITMEPNSFLLVWCSDKDWSEVGHPLHTNWKISAGGETITLTNAEGATVNSYPATVIPQNMSSGHSPDGAGAMLFFQVPTPGASNSTPGASAILSPPTFSKESGFYTAAFDLTISGADPNATIYYTLDGSDPSPSNLGGTTYQYKNIYEEEPGDTAGPLLDQTYQSLLYTNPINIIDRSPLPNKIANISTTFDFDPDYIPESPIFKGTVVRAIAIKDGALPSPIVTRTYFVTPLGSGAFSLPVVSISINEDQLFGYEDGIQVAGKDFDDWRAANPTESPLYANVGNFYRRGGEFEKIGNFSYLVNGSEVLNQSVGFRPRGGNSSDYPSKAMNIYARPEYGDPDLSYKFFNDVADNSFNRIMLRNGGGDFYGTMFRDELNQALVKELHNETEAYQPTIVFINGEYRGILNIREKYEENYFKRVIGTDNIDLLEDEGNIAEGDDEDYFTLVEYMQNNSLASQANYDYIQTRLDPESFTDYYIGNIYLDNVDWPGTNVVYWRKKVPYTPGALYGHDGRWRWAFHDMDDTFAIGSGSYDHDTLADATTANGEEWPNPEWSTLFLRRMLENENYKNHFINRFADLLNTSFLSSRVVAKFEELKNAIAQEMPGHMARWNTITTEDLEWYHQWETEFAVERPDLQRNHIRNKFSIGFNIEATLDVSDESHGYIHMNTIDVKDGTPGIIGNPYPWTGIYFSNIPVKMTAVAKPGFKFSHWTGALTDTNSTVSFSPETSFSITAVFVPKGTSDSQIRVYPNPTGGIVNIEGPENVRYYLYTIDGKSLKNGTSRGGTIDMSELQSGIYLLQLVAGGTVEVKKIIKT